MRRMVVLALLALALPMVASADIMMTNVGGTVHFNSGACAGLNAICSQGSLLHSFNSVVAAPGHALGTVNFQTGALISGSFTGTTGALFSSTGSSFNVIGKGTWGGHHWGNGTSIFSGAFVGNIVWAFVGTGPGHNQDYTLSGTIQGMLFDGRVVTGSTQQNVSINSRQQGNLGSGHIHTGSTNVITPEPGTLGLLGTGLVGIAGLARRKMKVS